MSTVELSIDGGAYLPVTGTEAWTYGWNTATVTGGAKDGVALNTRATDLAGNVTVSSTVTVDVHPYIGALSKVAAVRGEDITITGDNFTTSTTVNFPGASGTAIKTFTSSTSIVVTIPAGAVSGDLTVSTNGLTSNGKKLDIWDVITFNAGTHVSAIKDAPGNIYTAFAYSSGDRYAGFRKYTYATSIWETVVNLDNQAIGGGFSYTSVAVSGANVWVAYYDSKGNPVEMSISTNGGLNFPTKVNITTTILNYLSLGVSGTNLYLSGYDTTAKSLTVFRSDNSGATWDDGTTVDSELGGDIGKYASLGMMQNGYPVISYRDAVNKRLKLAYFDGSSWTKRIVDGSGNMGEYSSLKVDSAGGIHISYFNGNAADLMYAYASTAGGVFSLETVVSDGLSGYNTALALDAADKPHIVMYDYSANGMVYARKTGASWETFSIPDANAPTFPSTITAIVVDPTGKPWMYYPTGAGIRQANFIQ